MVQSKRSQLQHRGRTLLMIFFKSEKGKEWSFRQSYAKLLGFVIQVIKRKAGLDKLIISYVFVTPPQNIILILQT